MKYTIEQTNKIIEMYCEGKSALDIASEFDVPERSIIAKLSAAGVYKRKQYLTKRGEPPVRKGEYIERIATLLDINVELLESLEKTTKMALTLLESKIRALKQE